MKKKVFTFAAMLLLPVLPLSQGGCAVVEMFQCMGKSTLKVFNWGEYIDKSVVSEFEKKNNVCVRYTRFESVETAMLKMENETFDVVFLSDYGIEELAQNDQLVALDWSKFTTKVDDVADGIKEMLTNNDMYVGSTKFDYLKYAAPYMMGELGIVYDKTLITEADLAKGWEILRDNRFRVAMYDSPRDAFVPALSATGGDLSDPSEAEFNAAKTWLLDQKSTMGNKLVYKTDELLDDMPAKRHDLALIYSGDAISIMMEQEDMGYFRPADKGTNVFVDGMVIPSKSGNVELAHKFIAHMMTPDASYKNSSAIGYTAAIQSVIEELVEDEFSELADVYNFTVNPKDQMFRYLSEQKRQQYVTAFNQIKIS